MGAMRTHNFRMTPKVHVLVPHVPQYVRRTGFQFGPTFVLALESQNICFCFFYHRFKVNCTNAPGSRERFMNAVLHYNSCHF